MADYIYVEGVAGSWAAGNVYVLDEAKRTFYGPYQSVEEAELDQIAVDEGTEEK